MIYEGEQDKGRSASEGKTSLGENFRDPDLNMLSLSETILLGYPQMPNIILRILTSVVPLLSIAGIPSKNLEKRSTMVSTFTLPYFPQRFELSS